jgi:hypothetical protein
MLPGRAAFWVLGLGMGALWTTPICRIIVAVICGEDWREGLHNHFV